MLANTGSLLQTLRGLGIDVVLDFRSREEKSPDEAGFADAFNWVAPPVIEGSMSMKELVPRLPPRGRTWMTLCCGCIANSL